jgi:hypothetical protein
MPKQTQTATNPQERKYGTAEDKCDAPKDHAPPHRKLRAPRSTR